MTDESQSKTFTLTPSWKNHILGYIISVLLIPVFGIGLFALYWVYKRQKKNSYLVSDTQISSRDNKYQRNVDLISIEKVQVRQSWLQKKMIVGDLILHTSASSMTLRGMENPANLKDLLEKAITAQKQLQQQKEQTKPKKPDHDPGTMDRMDYLTGLWQQGLVSDEDYENERKHFE
ncbi:MAG TPA: hypothetical protein VJ964_12380 [Balneolaceae bacterium]|nr:hypothetical protein [Balneolaceae bacterium]